jgi:hypothetical protein
MAKSLVRPWLGEMITMQSITSRLQGYLENTMARIVTTTLRSGGRGPANVEWAARGKFFAAFATATVLCWRAHSAESPTADLCSDPVHHQLDFWVGRWDVVEHDHPDRVVAHAVVERILNGCVLHEIYAATDGHKGESFTIYDSSRHTWHQTWVTDHGQLLMIEGGLHDSDMVLEGTDRAPDGKQRRVRGTWRPVKDGVQEIAIRSTDGGMTWTPWFDLQFRVHQP